MTTTLFADIYSKEYKKAQTRLLQLKGSKKRYVRLKKEEERKNKEQTVATRKFIRLSTLTLVRDLILHNSLPGVIMEHSTLVIPYVCCIII